MKKLLALLLSMVMAASLAVPAFADGPDGPPPDDYDYEGADPISAPMDENIHWWTVEDEWAYVCEEYPEQTAIFLEEAEAWYAQHAGWYDAGTFDEFVENVGGKEAACLSLFYDWKWEREGELARNELITAYGGVPGQTGVMVNGWYIKFPDAVPEIANGRTMVPVRALVEALGGEVSVYGSDVRCRLDGMTVIFTIGSTEAEVELAAEGDGCERLAMVVEMDCAPYIKGGRTYVPVRVIGEALGYEVGWDGEYQTAVLLDRKGVAEDWDQVFTILNRALASQASAVKEGKNYQANVKGNATLTAFDTLNGNQTYKLDLTGKTLLGTEAANGIYTLDLSDNLIDLLFIETDVPEEEAAELRPFLRGIELSMIMNREGLAWVRTPGMDALGGIENVWVGFDAGAELAEALFAGTEAPTVGGLLTSALDTGSAGSWAELSPLVQDCAGFLGDGAWTTDGGVSTLKLDLDSLDPGEDRGLKEALKELDITLKVDREGGVTVTGKLESKARYGTPAVRITVDGAQDSAGAKLAMTFHVANVGELKLTLDASRQATGEQPVTEPASGGVVPFDWPRML